MKKYKLLPVWLVILLVGITIACNRPSSSNEKWCDPITKLSDSLTDLSFRNPDSFCLILSQIPIKPDDSLNWYFRLLYYARSQFFKGNMDSSLAYTNMIEAYGKRKAPNPSISTILAANFNIRGAIMQNMNNRDAALNCFEQAYREVSRADMQREILNICINAADVSWQLSKLPESATWYRQAMFLADSLGIDQKKNSILAGLGLVYSDMLNYEQAHHYFLLADSCFPPKSLYEKHYFYNSWGNVYTGEKRPDKALECFKKALTPTLALQQPFAKAVVHANLGQSYLELKQLDSSRKYLDLAGEYFFNSPNADDAIRFYINGLYANLALKKNDFATAHHYLSMPFNPVRIGTYYLYQHYQRLMEYYDKIGNYAEAYKYKKLVTTYDDSIRNVGYLNSVAETDMRYRQDTALLRRNIAIATAKNQVSHLQSTIILTVTLLALTLIGAFSINGYIRRRNERKRKEQLSLITRLRMENVRNRFSPHFVFNILNIVIGSLSHEESKALPLKLLIQVLRSNLLISDKIAIPLQEEIELVKNYAGLRQSINPETPIVEWEISPDINLELLLPAMIIQIPVENALKHAFPPTYNFDETPLVSIRIVPENNDYIRIIIEDNGIGYVPGIKPIGKLHSNDTGTGIHILFRTVELLNLKNIHKMTFEITDRSLSPKEEHGTRVTILIPSLYNYNS